MLYCIANSLHAAYNWIPEFSLNKYFFFLVRVRLLASVRSHHVHEGLERCAAGRDLKEQLLLRGHEHGALTVLWYLSIFGVFRKGALCTLM